MALTNPTDFSSLTLHGAGNGTGIASHFIPDVWGPVLTKYFDRSLVFGALCNDLSPLVSSGGDTIKLPKTTNVAVASVTGTTNLTAEAQGSLDTGESETLIIDQHKASHVFIPDFAKVQSSYDLVNVWGERVAYSLAQEIDNYIIGKMLDEFEGTTGTDPSGNKLDAITASGIFDINSGDYDLEKVMKVAIGQTGSTQGWKLVLSPDAYASLSRSSNFATGTNAVLGAEFSKNGVVSKMAGMDIIISNNASMGASHEFDDTSGNADDIVHGFLVHDSALHIAYSQKPVAKASYLHEKFSTLLTYDAMYGCVVNNSTTARDKRLFLIWSES